MGEEGGVSNMKPPHIPRESPPSIPLVVLTLMVAIAVVFGSALILIRLGRYLGWLL